MFDPPIELKIMLVPKMVEQQMNVDILSYI